MFHTTNSLQRFILIWLPSIVMMAIILITFMPETSEAIYCWQCNSATDKFCEDVPKVQSIDNLHDCYKKIYKECSVENDKLNYTFCRKQVQTIDKETRIIRACGFIKSPQDCYWTKNPPATTLVCQCDGDGCNHAFGLLPNNGSFFIIIGLPLLIAAIFSKLLF